jgi:hypothetical protein
MTTPTTQNNTFTPNDKAVSDVERRQIIEAANEIVSDTGFGKLTIEFAHGEIRLIEVNITRMGYNRAKRS